MATPTLRAGAACDSLVSLRAPKASGAGMRLVSPTHLPGALSSVACRAELSVFRYQLRLCTASPNARSITEKTVSDSAPRIW